MSLLYTGEIKQSGKIGSGIASLLMLVLTTAVIAGFWQIIDIKTELNRAPFALGTVEASIVAQGRSFPVTITTYHANAGETDDSPCLTADGTEICHRPPDAPRICAVSPDLAGVLPFGSVLTLTSLDGFFSGSCVVHDRTNARLKNTIDVLIGDGERGGLFKGEAVAK